MAVMVKISSVCFNFKSNASVEDAGTKLQTLDAMMANADSSLATTATTTAIMTTTSHLQRQSFNDDDEIEELFPPENFVMVTKGIFRSSFPKRKNFAFMKRLGLKTILTLILEEYPDQNMRFLHDNGIKLMQFGIAGNKEPFAQIPPDQITAALSAILDRRNHPMLIHCNKGKHRTGCLVGCLRKLQGWSYTAIFDEYRLFSHPKSRAMDQQFIELYDAARAWDKIDMHWLPKWNMLDPP